MKKSLLFSLILPALWLNACSDKARTFDPSDEKHAKAAQLQDSFTKPIVKLISPKDNSSHIFGVKNCYVYKAVQTENLITDWELLFKPAPYALPKTCIVERLEMEDGFLHIEIGTQALGAGGCCTTYAAYRSLDGQAWEIRPATSIKTWQPLKMDD